MPFDASIQAVTDCKVETSRAYVEHLVSIASEVRAQLTRTNEAMSRSANRKRRDHDIVFGD